MYQRRFVLWDIVLFPTSDVKGVSTYKIPNYPHACPTLYAAITNELNC